jgi:hypothetical protein
MLQMWPSDPDNDTDELMVPMGSPFPAPPNNSTQLTIEFTHVRANYSFESVFCVCCRVAPSEST